MTASGEMIVGIYYFTTASAKIAIILLPTLRQQSKKTLSLMNLQGIWWMLSLLQPQPQQNFLMQTHLLDAE